MARLMVTSEVGASVVDIPPQHPDGTPDYMVTLQEEALVPRDIIVIDTTCDSNDAYLLSEELILAARTIVLRISARQWYEADDELITSLLTTICSNPSKHSLRQLSITINDDILFTPYDYHVTPKPVYFDPDPEKKYEWKFRGMKRESKHKSTLHRTLKSCIPVLLGIRGVKRAQIKGPMDPRLREDILEAVTCPSHLTVSATGRPMSSFCDPKPIRAKYKKFADMIDPSGRDFDEMVRLRPDEHDDEHVCYDAARGIAGFVDLLEEEGAVCKIEDTLTGRSGRVPVGWKGEEEEWDGWWVLGVGGRIVNEVDQTKDDGAGDNGEVKGSGSVDVEMMDED